MYGYTFIKTLYSNNVPTIIQYWKKNEEKAIPNIFAVIRHLFANNIFVNNHI